MLAMLLYFNLYIHSNLLYVCSHVRTCMNIIMMGFFVFGFFLSPCLYSLFLICGCTVLAILCALCLACAFLNQNLYIAAS